jgi:glutamyl-tRNA synthetase
MSVVVRFAPSPTGFLHIGGARTALFNWLFARHHGGKFLLRIEDTDRIRSTSDAVAAIVDGLDWLGLAWDGDVVHQFERAPRHGDVARQLLAEGRAYCCYCTPAELEAMRERARAEKRSVRYDGTWRDRDPFEAPAGVAPAIRLKAPQQGVTTIHDRVQGEVTVANTELDDLIILRGDGTPTYNLSVVVDDHDMDITHVIRGDDHLNNAFRQKQIYDALGWTVPEFAHVPLIHGPDGAKLSKRHGALGVDAYRELGYLPEALRNYLLRLGWSHGDDEIISIEQAIEWFDIDAVGRAPARFDFAKLDSLNGHYIRQAPDDRLVALIAPRLEQMLGHAIDPAGYERLLNAMRELKRRPKTLAELAGNSRFLVADLPLQLDNKAAKLLTREARRMLAEIASWLTIQVFARALKDLPQDGAGSTNGRAGWNQINLETRLRMFAEAKGLKLGDVAQPLRAALTGSTASPGLFFVLEVLGREQTLARIADAAGSAS